MARDGNWINPKMTHKVCWCDSMRFVAQAVAQTMMKLMDAVGSLGGDVPNPLDFPILSSQLWTHDLGFLNRRPQVRPVPSVPISAEKAT